MTTNVRLRHTYLHRDKFAYGESHHLSPGICRGFLFRRRVEKWSSRRAHNPESDGSNPPLATKSFGLRLRGRDHLGHAGVKVKWGSVEARHGVNAQADALRGYAAATFSGRYSQFTAMPDSAPVTPNHACGRRKQGSPLVIKAKAPAPCSAGVTPASPAPIPRL